MWVNYYSIEEHLVPPTGAVPVFFNMHLHYSNYLSNMLVYKPKPYYGAACYVIILKSFIYRFSKVDNYYCYSNIIKHWWIKSIINFLILFDYNYCKDKVSILQRHEKNLVPAVNVMERLLC